MITRDDLLKSPEYWFEAAQNDFYNQVVDYMESNGLNKTELAEKLGVTKGYITQILSGNINFTLKKLIELGLSIDVVPEVKYVPIEKVLRADKFKQSVHLNAHLNAYVKLEKTSPLRSNTFKQYITKKEGMSRTYSVGKQKLYQ